MADTWPDVMPSMLRVLINDLSETPDYSSERLEEILIVAAHYVQQELEFDNDYTVSISEWTISPDPVTQGETEFVNFVVLKAACIIDQGNMRVKAATSGLVARCGPSELRTLEQMDGFKILMAEGSCSLYKQMKKEYKFGNRRYVKAVLSPFVSNDWLPFNHHHNRERG